MENILYDGTGKVKGSQYNEKTSTDMTLGNIFKDLRGGYSHAFGMLTAFVLTIWIFLNIFIWEKFARILFGKINNGYLTILLAPLILCNWAFALVLWLGICIMLTPLFLFSLVWVIVAELPASILNGNLGKQDWAYDRQVLNDGHGVLVFCGFATSGLMILVLMGLIFRW